MPTKRIIEQMNAAEIKKEMCADSLFYLTQLQIFDVIDSTNTYLLQKAKNKPLSGVVCLSDAQTQGRGRLGKSWYSPRSKNIYCSLTWNFVLDRANLAPFSLAVSVMIVRALKRLKIANGIQLKWPNDIYYGSCKLAGILIETLKVHKDKITTVIGIGINVASFEKNSDTQNAIALEDIFNHSISRNKLAGILLDELFLALPRYAENGFAAFISEWQALDMLKQKKVTIRAMQQEIKGIAEGINLDGQLIIRDEAGNTQLFHGGEVSVQFK